MGVVTFAGTAAAADTATITASPNTVDTVSTHTAIANPEDEDEGQGLESIQVDYNSAQQPADVENVSKDDVKRIGIDQTGDGQLDVNLSSNFTEIKYNNNFATVTFYFDGSYEINQSDEVLVEYGNVTNPNEPGDYQTQIAINVESTDHPAKAELNIEEDTEGTHTGRSDADPNVVKPGENVSNQHFEFEIYNLSADGTNDTFRVTLSDALGDRFSGKNATIVAGPDNATVSDITVENDPDDDSSKNDTMLVEFAYNNSTVNNYDLTLQLTADVDYPEDSAGTTYSIDTEINDSVNGVVTEAGVESININDSPTISNFSVENTEGTNLYVTFNSDRTLSELTVDIGGDDTQTLGLSDFDDNDDGNGYNYSATYDPGALGNYTATMTYAKDNQGNVLQEEPSDTVTIDCDDSDSDSACPTVSNFTLTNTSGSTYEVSFDSDKTLTTILVNVTGDADMSLNETDFTNSSGTYTASFDPGTVGNYTATLETAIDADGNDSADGQSDSVTHLEEDSGDSDSDSNSDSDDSDSDSDSDSNDSDFIIDDGTDDSDDSDTDDSDTDDSDTDDTDDSDTDDSDTDDSDDSDTDDTDDSDDSDTDDTDDSDTDDSDDSDTDDTDDSDTDDSDDSDTDDSDDSDDETPVGQNEATGGIPGFGLAVALFGLMAAALLALRKD